MLFKHISVILRSRNTRAMNWPESSVGVAGVEGLEAVTQVRHGTAGGQWAGQVLPPTVGPVPAAYQGVGHHQGDVVGVRPATPLDGNGNMSQGHAVISHANLHQTNISFNDMLHIIVFPMKPLINGFVNNYHFTILNTFLPMFVSVRHIFFSIMWIDLKVWTALSYYSETLRIIAG